MMHVLSETSAVSAEEKKSSSLLSPLFAACILLNFTHDSMSPRLCLEGAKSQVIESEGMEPTADEAMSSRKIRKGIITPL